VGDSEEANSLVQLIEHLTDDTGEPSAIEPIIIRRNGKRPVIISVLQVPMAGRNRSLGARPSLLTVIPLGSKPRLDMALLARVFRLTRAEAKLASALAGGKSIEEAAEELTISRETARNQLKSVFAKTAVHRQSELVALLSQLSGIAIHDPFGS